MYVLSMETTNVASSNDNKTLCSMVIGSKTNSNSAKKKKNVVILLKSHDLGMEVLLFSSS